MAYDTDLAERIREQLATRDDVAEQRMFGGLAFLVGGHMAVAASGQGGLMVRVDPAEGAALVAEGKADPMVMRGKPMSGWLRLSSDAVRTTRQLTPWVRRGTAYAATLPPKSTSAKRGRASR
jgi:TfoX/Sxy family transcriptional regulator of competence genes